MNIEASLTAVSRTGKVTFGSNATLKNMREGKGKLIIISGNCAPKTYSKIKQHSELTSVPVLVFKGSSSDLGSVCRKPFPVSAMTIFEAGDSDILELVN